MGNPVVRNIKELDSVRSSDLDDNKDISALVSGRTNVCQECDLRTRDEPHKQDMLAEIHLAYDEIL